MQGFPPDLHFGSFIPPPPPQNLVLDPKKLGVRVLSNAYNIMINLKIYLFIYGLGFDVFLV